MKRNIDTEKIKLWFLEQKRDLPWRHDPSPYQVWISEVMLQQTQVSVVIPYFLRWMERFPTVQALATASLDEVIKMWEGLGYYSRARNLLEGAKYIVDHFHGELPQEEEKLNQIKGLGPYTIGAILSFAFHKRKAALDGNVIRVLTRYFQIGEDVGKAKTLSNLRQLVEEFLPEEESWLVNEGLIELGATVCQKRPICSKCPLKTGCQAYLHGTSAEFPVKMKKIAITHLHRIVPIILSGESILIKRGDNKKIMQDLHEFPYFEAELEEEITESLIEARFGLKAKFQERLPAVSHSFTRYQVRLSPSLFETKELIDIPGHQWKNRWELENLAFSSGHKRILLTLKNKWKDDFLKPF